ncbi:MAG: fused MFS/spermidine synthase [Planctomycetota bacterium]
MSRLINMWRANSPNPDVARRASVNWIMLIYFASGACSLIDEVVWVRLLKLTLGNTVYASSIVVSMFMGGLALGALIMGRYSDRVKEHLRLYALLETLVTISALLLPWALKLADNLYIWFYRTYDPTHGQLLIVQVIISAAILLVPSMIMGSTLPLLGRFVTALEKEAGHLVGKLYALNTLGAAAGCFLAGFIFIRAFGVMGALYTAAGLNLLVAFGGWFLSRFSGVDIQEKAEAAAAKTAETAPAKTTNGRFYLLILAFFMSGLISIAYELLWMRSIIHLLGGVTYVFSAVLTIYLLGNVIGAGIGSRLAKRLKTPALGFAVTLSLLGFCGVFYLPALILWISTVLPLVNNAFEAFYSWIPVSPYIIKPLLQGAFLFLLPAVIMGIGFPIALQAWANHVHKIGRSTGTAYGANTIGAVIGGIITGFVLIPLLGLQTSIAILGLIGLWIAAVMSVVFARNLNVVSRLILPAVAVVLTIITTTVPSNLFSTVVKINPKLPSYYELVSVKEGITTTISLHRDVKDGSLRLHSSGQSVAGDNYVERGDQKMLGHFGVFLNSGIKNILSVGFGSGETTACLSKHNLERVDCVEIAPEIVKTSLEFFHHINLGDKLNEEVNMIYMDAKNYIHLTDSKYDVIINDSIHPRDFAENASLYTKEYFESAKQRLSDNGMILSWLPTYDMPASVFDSIIGTQLKVFPYVTVWHLTPHPAPLILVAGSKQQQYYSPKYIDNILLKENIKDSMAQINIHNSMDVLTCYIADRNDLIKQMGDFHINSDYSPFVEFTTDDETPHRQMIRKYVINLRSKSVYDHIDWMGFTEPEKQKWLTDYKRLYEASSYLFMAYDADNYFSKLQYCMDGLVVLPNNPALRDFRKKVEERLFRDSISLIQLGKTDQALALADQILSIYPQSSVAWIIKSVANRNKGNLTRALSDALRSVDLAPESEDAHFNIGFIFFQLGRFEKAITEYEATLRFAEQSDKLTSHTRVKILDALASAYYSAGRREDAISTTQKALELASATGQKQMAEKLTEQLLSLKAVPIP